MIILVINAGSSTLKFSVIESEREQVLGSGMADWSVQPARLVIHIPNVPDAVSSWRLSTTGTPPVWW